MITTRPTSVENLLNESTGFLQILDAISDMILVKEAKSKLVWANKAFCEYYGMSPEQLKGLIDAPFSEPDFTAQYVKDDSFVFESGKTLDIPEEPVKGANGVIRYFHTVKSPIFDTSGKVILTVGISRDITDQKEHLKTIENERAKNLQSARMAALGEMAGGIAHEINTPLALIRLYGEQLMEDFRKSQIGMERMKKSAEKIVSTVDRISKIICGLKTFYRDGSRDKPTKVNVGQLIEETLAFCGEKFRLNEIEVSVQIEDPKLELTGSASQISQIILNLLNNSVDAILDQEKKWIRIFATRRGKEIEISITDCGKGIPESIHKNLFSPFFTTKEVGKGTGVGLHISQSIAQQYGGDLRLDAQSKNTKFVLSLPSS